jgi:hypothetical protein
MGNAEGDQALVAAVTYPPRVGDAQPIAELMPHVLARYGLADAAVQDANAPAVDDSVPLDLLA